MAPITQHDKLPLLSGNGQKLIQKLAELPRTWLTAATLADAVGISRRTVLRELPGVEDWLHAAGFAFYRSPGKGLLLDEPEERRALLLRQLNGTADHPLSRDDRRHQLLATLFSAPEPVKTYALAYDLGVSERTLKGDLDQLEGRLQPFGVTLRRRPGVGIWLDGSPENLRRALRSLLQSSIPQQEMQSVLRGVMPRQGVLSAFLPADIAETTLHLLQQFIEQEGFSLSDTGFLCLAIHVTLAVQQLRSGSGQSAPRTVNHPLNPQAERLTRMLEAAFALRFPPEEVRYLADYLDAYQPNALHEKWDTPEEWEVRHLAVTMIQAVSAGLAVDLSRYPTLADDLCCHLRPMLHRLRCGGSVENPQLTLIQEQYPRLWESTRLACDMVAEQMALPAIPDEEAGFLAMHFGAIIEKDELAKMRLRAAVVCPHGMASCRFLVSQLQRDFPVFHISRCCPVRELNPDTLRADGIDLIICTIPLQVDFPCICVSTVLQEQDRVRLRDVIAHLQGSDRTADRPRYAPTDGLRYMGDLTAGMLELLDHLTLETVPVPRTRDRLLQEAARLFCTLEADRAAVLEGLTRREAMADTYIRPLRSLLLHCKTNAVPGCRLGYLKAEPPVYEAGRIITGALVMLAPDSGSEAQLQVMQSVSALLVEEPRLMEAFRKEDRAAALSLLRSGLEQRFKK